jgi:chromosome segregation ATPase
MFMDDPFTPLPPRRWPWIVAIIASLIWAAALIAAWGGISGRIQMGADTAGLLAALAMLAGPLAVAILAAVQLRDAGAVSAARAAIADRRTQEAAEWLEHSAEALARLEGQLEAATAKMAALESPVSSHSATLARLASALDASNDRLSETVAAAVTAGENVAGVVPAANAQAEALLELLARADNQLRSQLAETETLLASLYTRASEAEAEARTAAQASRGEINQLAEVSQSSLKAMADAAAQARAAVAAPLGALQGEIDAAFQRTGSAVDSTREALQAQTSALLATVDQARTTLDHIAGEAARALEERLAALQDVAARITRDIEATSRNTEELVDDLGGRVEALAQKLGQAMADNESALAGLDARIGETKASAAGLTAPLGEAETLMEGVQEKLSAMAREAEAAMALLEEQLPAGASLVASLEERLAALQAGAATLAEPLAASSSSIEGASERLNAARAALDASTQGLGDAIATALSQMRELEDGTSRLGLTASGELAETFGRVRQIADAAAGSMRQALAGVIAEAESALERSAIDRTEVAFAGPIRSRIEELVSAQNRAANAAQLASERVAQRLIALTRTISEVEAHVDAVETRSELRARNALGRRANSLIDSLQASAVNMAELLDFDIDDKTWGDYAAGDRSAIARRLSAGLDRGAGRIFLRHYTHDQEFRTEASRYLADFEALVADIVPERGGEALGATLLSSTLGKLYLAIGQAAGRFN